jgi:hypothetical protein
MTKERVAFEESRQSVAKGSARRPSVVEERAEGAV